MSIVVAMIFPNEGVVMYADKRSITIRGSEQIVRDDFVKVHFISKTIACGITGNADWGLALIAQLKRSSFTNASEIIQLVETYSGKVFPNSTVTLGGIFDDGKPFLWTFKSSDGTTTMARDYIGYTIATFPEELGSLCGAFLVDQFQESKNPNGTLISTIKFAAAKSNYISPMYDSLLIPYKTP